MPLYRLEDRTPEIDPGCYIAPSADVIGSVRLAAGASIWFNAVLRGDNDPITIGRNSNIQDNTVVHTDPGIPATIGDNVTVGHSVMLHGCLIGDGALIGIGSIVLNKAEIGEQCIVGAGALVTEGKVFPPRSLIVGSPGRVVRQLRDDEVAMLATIADSYSRKISRYQTLSVID